MRAAINLRRRVAVVGATTLASLVIAACGVVSRAERVINGTTCGSGPVVYAITDVSGSTAAVRQPGGLYETGIWKVIADTAAACGELFAGPLIDGNAPGNTVGWIIDGRTFRQITVGGNAQLGAAARAKVAVDQLGPNVQALLTTRETNGSDQLGAMQRVALAAIGVGNPRKTLVMFSDGVLNLPGRYSLYQTPIGTPAGRAAFIGQLRAAGEIPNLTGFDVYLPGLGVGATDRELAKNVIALWQELVPLTGGRLRSTDASLQLASANLNPAG